MVSISHLFPFPAESWTGRNPRLEYQTLEKKIIDEWMSETVYVHIYEMTIIDLLVRSRSRTN